VAPGSGSAADVTFLAFGADARLSWSLACGCHDPTAEAANTCAAGCRRERHQRHFELSLWRHGDRAGTGAVRTLSGEVPDFGAGGLLLALGGELRARSHCRFVLPLIHFILKLQHIRCLYFC
jgi:hypothetical protein